MIFDTKSTKYHFFNYVVDYQSIRLGDGKTLSVTNYLDSLNRQKCL